jgi:hypothetical protein
LRFRDAGCSGAFAGWEAVPVPVPVPAFAGAPFGRAAASLSHGVGTPCSLAARWNGSRSCVSKVCAKAGDAMAARKAAAGTRTPNRGIDAGVSVPSTTAPSAASYHAWPTGSGSGAGTTTPSQ